MAEETSSESNQVPESHPPGINGPAFLAFGIVFVVLGVLMEMSLLTLAGALFSLVGLVAIVLLRRWEKVHGIEDVLPGGPPSASAQAAAEEKARAQALAEESSGDPGTTSPDS